VQSEFVREQVIRKELEVSGIQDVRLKYTQNWINHLERMDNTRLQKHALNYKPRGRRDRGRPGNDGNASMPEKVKRPNPWRKMMMMNNITEVKKRICQSFVLRKGAKNVAGKCTVFFI